MGSKVYHVGSSKNTSFKVSYSVVYIAYCISNIVRAPSASSGPSPVALN